MPLPPFPPRRVLIGHAAALAGTTPRTLRHYHEIGLLPEPERGGDGRRRYGYADVVRLLWVRRTAEAGIPLADVRDAVIGAAPSLDDGVDGGTGEDAAGDTAGDTAGDARGDDGGDAARDAVLERLERSLLAREAELRRRLAAVRALRRRGGRAGLLPDVVADRLAALPAGSVREADLDDLLVVDRLLGPAGALVRSTRVVALATSPRLRAESDRVDAAEEALDETVAVDDPRVAEVAAARHTFERELHAVVERSGLAREEEDLLDAWEAEHPAPPRLPAPPEPPGTPGTPGPPAPDDGRAHAAAVLAATAVPYDVPPARRRCHDLAQDLLVVDVQDG